MVSHGRGEEEGVSAPLGPDAAAIAAARDVRLPVQQAVSLASIREIVQAAYAADAGLAALGAERDQWKAGAIEVQQLHATLAAEHARLRKELDTLMMQAQGEADWRYSLTAQLVTLREALAPFAGIAERLSEELPDDDVLVNIPNIPGALIGITRGDCRRARAAWAALAAGDDL